MPMVSSVSRAQARAGELMAVREGLLHGGLPYRAVGSGPPVVVVVVVLPGISADTTGAHRRMNLRTFLPLTHGSPCIWSTASRN